jgi:hypothetical protein
LNAKPELQRQILNANITQNFPFTLLSLGLKICENLGFSLSEIVSEALDHKLMIILKHVDTEKIFKPTTTKV